LSALSSAGAFAAPISKFCRRHKLRPARGAPRAAAR
jgi:hypothetical protein